MGSFYIDPPAPCDLDGDGDYVFPTGLLRKVIASGGTGSDELDTLIMETLIEREQHRTAALS